MADTSEYRVAEAGVGLDETLLAIERPMVEGRAGRETKARGCTKRQKDSHTRWYWRAVDGAVAALSKSEAVRAREAGEGGPLVVPDPAMGRSRWPCRSANETGDPR